jgi:hypothetical protein
VRGKSPNAIRSDTRSRWLGKSMVGPDPFGATIDVASQKPDRPKEIVA